MFKINRRNLFKYGMGKLLIIHLTHSVCHYQYQQFPNFLYQTAFPFVWNILHLSLPFSPVPSCLTCTSVSFIYWNMFSCVHAHTIHQTPPAQETCFTCIFTDMSICICICVCGCTCVCTLLHTHAHTYVTNVQRQAGERSVSILIRMKISGKTIEFQYKCALKHSYFLSKIYPFLLLFQWYNMFYWTTLLVDVTAWLGQDGKNYPALHMPRKEWKNRKACKSNTVEWQT